MIGLCFRLIRIFGKEDRIQFMFLFMGIILSSALEIMGTCPQFRDMASAWRVKGDLIAGSSLEKVGE